MGMRLPRYVIAVALAAGALTTVAVTNCRAQIVAAYEMDSLEWLVADGAVIVRGVIVDLAEDKDNDGWLWKIVTLDVHETLKGAKVERLKFAVLFRDLSLKQWQDSKSELLWILKRSDSSASPLREVLARHKTDLSAPSTRANSQRSQKWMPSVIPLGPQVATDAKWPARFMTTDLRVLDTPDELIKAIQAAVAEKQGPVPVRSHRLELPGAIAERSGEREHYNYLIVPVDHRLETIARRLIESPADFLRKNNAGQRDLLVSEGAKALRLFRTEKTLAFLQSKHLAPDTLEPIKEDSKNQVEAYLPPAPTAQKREPKLPLRLAEVPEVHFQQPLARTMNTVDAQFHTEYVIDRVHALNQKKTDGFIEALMSKRPDLAGLPFAMGDACRMKEKDSRQFAAFLGHYRSVKRWELQEARIRFEVEKGAVDDAVLTELDRALRSSQAELAAVSEETDSARVAVLMQVQGADENESRLELVRSLDGSAHADATRALAKLAIFSEEPEIRSAALRALKLRRDGDYTDILLSGLKYPWPAVAERSSEAIVQLGRRDLVPHLIDVLETPDPRAPQTKEVGGKKVAVVRELVRINHHHNCLLCHAPATSSRDGASKEESDKLAPLTAQVPVPSEAMNAYYSPNSPDILVRFDVTYLRQDFSLNLRVADADPWPEMQRYDFLVRTRELTEQEAVAFRALLAAEAASPYRRAALSALRELTGQDTESTGAAWRKRLRPWLKNVRTGI